MHVRNVGKVKAKKIMDYIKENGQLTSIHDLKKIGLGRGIFVDTIKYLEYLDKPWGR